MGSSRIALDGGVVFQASEYDRLGRVQRVSKPFTDMPLYVTSYFDYLDQLTSISYPDDSTALKDISRTYPAYKVESTDRLGQKVTHSFHGDGRLSRIQDDAQTINLKYTARGMLDTAKGGVTWNQSTLADINYDLLGRKISQYSVDTEAPWRWTYNALDQIATQTDPNGTVTYYHYDQLGRLIQRTWDATAANAELRTTQWHFDTAANGVGQLAALVGFDTDPDPQQFYEEYHYTALGQLSTVSTFLDSGSYQAQYYYDAYSRHSGLLYPGGGVAIGYAYNGSGYLTSIYDALKDETAPVLWEAKNNDQWGNLTEVEFGNEVTTLKGYDPLDGELTSVNVSKGNIDILNHSYGFDNAGNLKDRDDLLFGIYEDFCYDTLNRLTDRGFGSCGDESYSYDMHGNVTSKGILQSITHASRIHRIDEVTVQGQVQSRRYVYDKAGNVILRAGIDSGAGIVGGDVVHYSPFGKPAYMGGSRGVTEIIYGPSERRIKRIDDGLKTTTYIGKLLELTEGLEGKEFRYYIEDFAIYTEKNTTGYQLDGEWVYLHRDHIGSIAATTPASLSGSNEIDWRGYEPWGSPLKVNWSGAPETSLEITSRGFTDHEHLESVELIHMNGRVYDPLIGRFLSPDPIVEDPLNTQSYNRYSYVLNNPLSLTDPTGYSSCGSAPICVDEGAGRSNGWGGGAPSSGTMAGLASGAMHFQGGMGPNVPNVNSNTFSQNSNQQLAMSEAGQVMLDSIHHDGVAGVDPKHPDTQAGYLAAGEEVVTLMVGGVAVKVVMKAGKIVKIEKLGDKVKDALKLNGGAGSATWKTLGSDRQNAVNSFMTQFGKGPEGAKKLQAYLRENGVPGGLDKQALAAYRNQIQSVGGNKAVTKASEVFNTRVQILNKLLGD
ncbi:RHS repeat domain-containing protein [Oceanicoccus sp. KOV_DT_Chl]|uniref:RHS repeat domain-containing protein n=1 Tax=Oceanicoccus sp. KOV_DT_Chl TaxID=1904639 RepID=UPI000C7DA278|nr:RHS repeat-associated core domain-containing protein [Oceanicoccus sp. KOV_DT_Chl]